jgi:hypothetical protein
MTMFFLDLWHDLREKRLWPVAVGLIAAIVAVPVILFKPASDAAPPATIVPRTNGAETLPVVSVDSGPTVGSRLEAYNEKNPFKPMKDLAKATTQDTSGATASGNTSTSGGGTGTSPANPNGTSTPSSSGGSSSPTGGTSPGGSSTPGTTTTTQTVKWFRYTADFSFGEPGAKPTTFKDQASFTLLPDDKTPSIVFMGVNADHKHAMFFISDPGFQAQGEGKCNASGAACRFVTLSLSDTSDEETFTSVDGSVSYDLKLLKLNRDDLATDKNGNPVAPPNGKAQVATGAGVASTTASAESVVPDLFGAGPGLVAEQK